ncbi:hypothetical protein CSE16_08895 [Solibacillus sp. R5-41]|uniref:hypothetical protein n=1 Tax=Solibacillus sp. R5-41 TaxID=2048654 RepID=UPI000C127C77|nr:hypothetical protein [Solibacillus sp. R5-41]ATP40156.1 hypothetical protein CSE16_08895 [Solibacillus sp. R5-41]
MNQKLRFIGLLLLPLLLYVVGFIVYFSDNTNSFVFLLQIMIGLTLSVVFVILYKKQQNIFLELFIPPVVTLVRNATNSIGKSYKEPIEVFENTGIHVMVVHLTDVPYIIDPDYMIKS